jgi:hypothetical protein
MSEQDQAIQWVIKHMPRESAQALTEFVSINTSYNGAAWGDVLDILLNSDTYVSITDLIYQDAEMKDLGMLPAAVAVTLMLASKTFATNIDDDTRLMYVRATIQNNGGSRYVPRLHDGFRVVQIIHVPVNRKLYVTATAAQDAATELSKANPDRSYTVIHASIGVSL